MFSKLYHKTEIPQISWGISVPQGWRGRPGERIGEIWLKACQMQQNSRVLCGCSAEEEEVCFDHQEFTLKD